MASDTNRTSAENRNARENAIVNGENEEENSQLLIPARACNTSQNSQAVYASIQQGQTDDGNLLRSITNMEQSISRARQVREAKDFPYTRARVAALATVFCYMVSGELHLLRKRSSPRCLSRNDRKED